jgi:hypothetical protein
VALVDKVAGLIRTAGLYLERGPATVAGYNPASFHPVVITYRGRQPWTQYRDHHARYYRPVVARPNDRGRGHGRC